MFNLIPDELLVAACQMFCYCLVAFMTVVTWLFVPRT